MIIRPATKFDTQSIVLLMQEADNRQYNWAEKRASKYSCNKNKFILVAEERSKLLAYVGIKNNESDDKVNDFINTEKYLTVTWIAVHPSARGRGIGTQLLIACEKYVKTYRKKGLWLDCRKKLIPFYTKNGYKIAGSFEKKENPQYVLVKDI